MKKYIIFFVIWLLSILFGFFMFFADRASLGFVSIVNLWVKSSCIYSVLIGYAVAFCTVIVLYLKDKLKIMKLQEEQDRKRAEKEEALAAKNKAKEEAKAKREEAQAIS